MLTNDIVSFEQPGPGLVCTQQDENLLHTFYASNFEEVEGGYIDSWSVRSLCISESIRARVLISTLPKNQADGDK